MSVLSLSCCSLLSAVFAFTLVSAAGCGPDAKGIDDCRQIEQARCAAAKDCGFVSDVPSCQRFYRDQCLHGLPVESPGSTRVQECVTTIRNAGLCAQQAEGEHALLSQCDLPVTQGARGVLTACGLVQTPEKATECSFLKPGTDAGVDDASSAAGSGNPDEEPAQAGSGGDTGG